MEAEKFRALCQMTVMNAKTLDDAAALSVKESGGTVSGTSIGSSSVPVCPSTICV